MVVRSSRVIQEMIVLLMARRVDLTGRVDLRNRIWLVVLLRLRRFELIDCILKVGRIKGPQSERICHTITASNTWRLRMGLLGVLPLLWVSGRITRPETAFRRQCHGWRTWGVTLLILRLRTTRMLYILIITVMPLLCVDGLPLLVLDVIFTPIAFGARIVVSIKPFRKEVR